VRLNTITNNLINNLSISEADERFLKQNILNDPSLSLFAKILDHCPQKLPSNCTKYMTNPQSIIKFKFFLDIFENEAINGHLRNLQILKKGIMSSRHIPASYKAVFGFFLNVAPSTIPSFNTAVISEILALQYKYYNIPLDNKIYYIINEGIVAKKITNPVFNHIISLICKPDASSHINQDKTLSHLLNTIDHYGPMLTGQNCQDILSTLQDLKQHSMQIWKKTSHHMTERKLDRIKSLQNKYRFILRELLKDRKDAESKMCYLLI
jgi:hypothetical protein